MNQIQVRPSIGLTFASGLRHIVRQDPDVIMVGEIRDGETAGSRSTRLTGHLVLSTLHTNAAAGAVARILDMGAEPYLVASSLIGSVAQRLVRLNCPACKRQEEPDPDAIREVGLSAEERAHAAFMRGAKCEECGFTGYRGRAGVFELLTVDDEVRRMITQRASAIEIKRHALANKGMRTLIADGRDKVVRGLTTIDEVLQSASATSCEWASNREPRAKMGKMVGYRYIAVDSAGREVRGHVEAGCLGGASRVRELASPGGVFRRSRARRRRWQGAGAQGGVPDHPERGDCFHPSAVRPDRRGPSD